MICRQPEKQARPKGIRKVLGSFPAARENIYTIPNLLTVSRLVAAPFIGYCILHDYHAWTLGLFAWAGVSDLLDGWIARRWNSGTVVGTVIDPMADKTLMTILTVTLAIKGALPGKLDFSPIIRQGDLSHTDYRGSLAGSHHSRTGRRPRHCSDLLQVDLLAAPQDFHQVLGLLSAFG
jgi:hypothetical protein